jgi:hypothetical protein
MTRSLAVRVLLDEQLPRLLARELKGHYTRTVAQQGWGGRHNGELLRLAEDAGFEVFLTADQNLRFQQNLAKSRLGVILLIAGRTSLKVLLPLMQKTLTTLGRIRPGELIVIDSP